MFHQLKIASRNGGAAQVILDGIDIRDAVTGLSLKLEAGQPAEVTLHTIPDHTYFHGAAKVMLPRQTHEALVRLGWTPPPPEGGGE
jgi:hypothetical protein